MGSKRLTRLIAACALACSTHLAAAPSITAPAWSDLTPDQQRTLAPLAREWRDLPDERKRKWAGIANRFPGQTLKWDTAALRFTNNDAANALIDPPYREGWKVLG